MTLLGTLFCMPGCRTFGGHPCEVRVRAADESQESPTTTGADLYLVPRADWNRLKLGERWFGLAADGESREAFLGGLRRFRYERSRTPVTVKIEPKAWVFVLARDGKLGMAEVAAQASHLEDVVIDLR